MNKENQAGNIISLAMVIIFVAILLWYGNTEVAFKIQGDTLYRQIKNGRVGADCYDQDGVKVIAPSRFAGQDWVPIVSLAETSKEGRAYSIVCYPYAGTTAEQAVINLTGGE